MQLSDIPLARWRGRAASGSAWIPGAGDHPVGGWGAAYLGRPQARRGQDSESADFLAVRGDRRGTAGALAGFDTYEYRYADDIVLFRFQGLREYRRHELGEEHVDELNRAVAVDTTTETSAPSYLLDNEEAAESYFRRLRA